LALALLLSVLSTAQENDKALQLGFTLAPTVSWLTDDGSQLVSDGAKVGYSYGVLADFGFAKNYFFSTAFTLTSLNSKAKRASTDLEEYKLQYIEVPVTLKLKSNPTATGRFYGQFGLSTGVNVSAKMDTENVATKAREEDVTISSRTNLFRLGLIAGAGAEWSIGRNLSALTGVSFNNGFTKTFENADAKNPFVTLHLGVFF
jgi:hypothetical protein